MATLWQKNSFVAEVTFKKQKQTSKNVVGTTFKYSSTIPHNGDTPSVQCHYLIPSIQFSLQNQYCPPEILIPELIFHFLLFYSVILQYPQVFISIFFYLSYVFTTY